jgi:hypothetical protein
VSGTTGLHTGNITFALLVLDMGSPIDFHGSQVKIMMVEAYPGGADGQEGTEKATIGEEMVCGLAQSRDHNTMDFDLW